MTLARAERLLLERVGATDLALVSLHLALPMTPPWADGVDDEGLVVLLVGASALRQSPEGDEALAAVLGELRRGRLPTGVHAVHFEARASAAFAEVVGGASDEVLIWGSRASGKTVLAAGALLALAELSARAAYPLPLRVLWLHSSLVDASAKTARSLEEPRLWAGVWALREDRRVAAAAVGGRELVLADFVGAQDATTRERLRASCHAVVAEEAVGTLDEAGGIGEREYEVALTSTLRLEAARRVAVLTTNPGSREHWVYTRFLAEGHDPRRVAVHVPSRDRLSEAEVRTQAAPFRDSPDLRARLAEETWTDLKLGPEVAVGFRPSVHVCEAPPWLVPMSPIVVGWDVGVNSNVQAACVLQRNGPKVFVHAALTAQNTGPRRFINERVVPWFVRHAPWALGRDNAREFLTHVLDHSVFKDQAVPVDPDQDVEGMVRAAGLGSRCLQGAAAWQPRIAPLLDVLSDTADVALRIAPGPATELLRRALGGLWHYDVSRGGMVERDGPAKNEREFADAAEALCYGLSALHVSDPAWKKKPKGSTATHRRERVSWSPYDYVAGGRRRE